MWDSSIIVIVCIRLASVISYVKLAPSNTCGVLSARGEIHQGLLNDYSGHCEA